MAATRNAKVWEKPSENCPFLKAVKDMERIFGILDFKLSSCSECRG
jgi:hypothetical protein